MDSDHPPTAKVPGALCWECPLFENHFVPDQELGGRFDLVVVGEAPGVEEVKSGMPFMGNSGKLLGQTLSALETQTGKPIVTFLTNAVLCRPPDNREPTEQEIRCCRPRLLQALGRTSIGNPRQRVIALGNVAWRALGGTSSILSSRGTWYRLRGVDGWVIPSIHPAAVLRQPDWARMFFLDMGKAVKTDISQIEFGRSFANSIVGVEIIHETSRLHELFQQHKGERFAWDFETNQLDWLREPALLLSIAWKDYEGIVIPLDHPQAVPLHRKDPRVLEVLDTGFADGLPVGHNAKFDIMVARMLGLKNAWAHHDTMLAHYTLDELKGGHGLKALAQEYLDVIDYDAELVHKHLRSRNDAWSKVPFDDLSTYAVMDVCNTLRLDNIFTDSLNNLGMYEYPYRNVIMKLHELAVEMEWRGIQVDVEHLEHWKRALELEKQKRYTILCDLIGEDVNPNSPKQLAYWIYDHFKLTPPPTTSYDKIRGQINVNPRSTSMVGLAQHATFEKGIITGFKHPFLQALFQYRKVHKVLSTYVDKILVERGPDDRFHDEIKVHGTETGRISTFLHTMPRETTGELYRIVRSAFVAPPGKVFVSADGSQAELRTAAGVSNDPFFVETYRADRDADFHAAVANALFGEGQWGREQRMLVKHFNFAYVYGGSGAALVADASIPKELARKIEKDYDSRLAVFSQWRKDQSALMLQQGWVASPLGRRRRFPFISRVNMDDARKAAINFPIQATSSDITNLGALEVERAGYPVVLTKHDEVFAEVPLENAEYHRDQIVEIMESVGNDILRNVPWKVDPEILPRWTEPPPLSFLAEDYTE